MIRAAQHPTDLFFGQHHCAVKHLDQLHVAAFTKHQPIVAAHSLHPRPDAARLDHVRGDVAADNIISPRSRPLHKQTCTCILHQSERFRKVGIIDVNPVYPRFAPHCAVVFGALKGNVRRPVNRHIVEIEGAAGTALTCHFNTDFGDGVMDRQVERPCQHGCIPAMQSNRWPRHRF